MPEPHHAERGFGGGILSDGSGAHGAICVHEPGAEGFAEVAVRLSLAPHVLLQVRRSAEMTDLAEKIAITLKERPCLRPHLPAPPRSPR